MKWYVVCTKRNYEIRVSNALNAIGIHSYCPVIQQVKQYSDRKKKVDIPNLISNIVECPNGNCISNNERGAISKFKLIDSNMLIKCTYCGRKIKEESINFL